MVSFARRVNGTWYAAGLGLLALALVAVALIVLRTGPGDGDDRPRAVIADQLQGTAPDPAFVEEATALLEDAGYRVDYVPYEGVDVEFYRELPTRHYQVILLRTHAGLRPVQDGFGTIDAHLFTGEAYSETKHVDEQLADTLKAAGYNAASVARGELFFAIPVSFVRNEMEGDFGGAPIVLMGCDVFRSENLAQALVERGASTVVGWDELVTAEHTDAATLAWLRHYLGDGMSAQAATVAAGQDVGPDRYSGAELLAYPAPAPVDEGQRPVAP